MRRHKFIVCRTVTPLSSAVSASILVPVVQVRQAVVEDQPASACSVRARVPARPLGEHLFLPGGRREEGESPLECARRELREEAGFSARQWRSLDSHTITPVSTARVRLFEARCLTPGRRNSPRPRPIPS
ncbi:NUDIX hydrolase [Streptomyces pratens]|uniref:NUDIX hydrolase n=1 Tax=Streptomyces pratens TaxID=887456 RepID=A0ABW1MAD8_9ACTN